MAGTEPVSNAGGCSFRQVQNALGSSSTCTHFRDGKYQRVAGAAEFIDDDAVLARRARRRRRARYWAWRRRRSRRRSASIRSPSFGPERDLVAAVFDRGDRDAGAELDAVRWRAAPRHSAAISGGATRASDLRRQLQHRDLRRRASCAVAATSRPMKPAPMTASRTPGLRALAQRQRIVDVAQIEHARPIAARNRQAPRPRAGGEQQRVIGHAAAVGEPNACAARSMLDRSAPSRSSMSFSA